MIASRFLIAWFGGVGRGSRPIGSSQQMNRVEFIIVDERTLVVTTSGPSIVPAWLEDLASQSGSTTTEPIDIGVGGVSGISVDEEVSSVYPPDSCGHTCLVLFEYTWGHDQEQGGRLAASASQSSDPDRSSGRRPR
jgi:hypothetical protein